jgi:MoxR-like ATPase
MTVKAETPTLGRAMAGQRFAPDGAEMAHVFSEDEILAIRTAMAARRALLIRGEPGTGKTQIAKAAALALGFAFVSHTVDSRTEARDLLWYFDAVARLADAQAGGALAARAGGGARLPMSDYIHPRPLWWAFDWADALKQARVSGAEIPTLLPECDPGNGVVVLIDEIDKAEAEAPNGLLEALGAGRFTPQGFSREVRRDNTGSDLLVIVTTNEERTLPDAFVRRCLVLRLDLPDEEGALVNHLVARGAAHFPDAPDNLLRNAASQVARDRAVARDENWRPYPGAAEYIDLLRAVRGLAPGDLEAQMVWLDRVSRFALQKHADAHRSHRRRP